LTGETRLRFWALAGQPPAVVPTNRKQAVPRSRNRGTNYPRSAGGFLGVAGMLSPTAVTLINPFGYYAVLSPFTFRPEGLVSIEPLWIPWALFIAVVTVIFTVLCRTLDSQEE
ncbi:hypothetical protein ACL1E1_07170, partial [Corynebacterium striatum]